MESVSLASNNVFVFPSANRGYDYRGARYSSETNLTGLVKSGVNNSSYVLDDTGDNIRFVIEGYYFEVKKSELTVKFASSTNIYAYINITTPSSSDTQGLGKYLNGTDLNGKYEGVKFIDNVSGISPEPGCNMYSLYLYTRDSTSSSDAWRTPTASLQMYNLNHAYGIIPNVDGGELGGNGLLSGD